MKTSLGVLRSLIALAALAPLASAGVWIVDDDGGPGVDFTDLQPAIDAASPGDLVVVRAGEYGPFVLDIGLRIVAEPGPQPHVGESGELRDVPAGWRALVAGLRLDMLYAHDCEGDVLVDACTLGMKVGRPSLLVERCDLVVMSRSQVKGISGGQEMPPIYPPNAERAAEVTDSTVAWSACTLEGGSGGTHYKADGKPGEPAVWASHSTLFCQTSHIQGGHGGKYWGPYPDEYISDGGDGAPGLLLDACHVEIFGRATDLVIGGQDGVPSWFGEPGEPASAVVALDSDVIHSGAGFVTQGGKPVFDGTASSFDEVTPAVPPLTLAGDALLGGSFEPVLEAAPGAQFLLWISPFSGVQPVGNKHTQLLLASAQLFALAAGTVGPSGVFDLPLKLPDSPLLQGLALHLQAYVRLGPGADVLSTSASCALR
jgi:hypothetical protein